MKLRPGKFLYNTSVLHVENSVCIGDKIIKPVFRDNHGLFLRLPVPDHTNQIFDGGNIQIGGRFVQYENVRADCVSRCTGNFLLFPAGQGKQAPVQQFFQLEAVGGFLQTLPHLRDRQGHVFTPKNNLAGGIYIVELCPWVLEYRSHPLPDLIKRIVF